MSITWMHEHSLVLLLSLASIITFIWLFVNRERLHAKWYEALILTVLYVAWGMAAVKLFAALESGDPDMVKGMSLFGVVFTIPLAYLLHAKIRKLPFLEVADVVTVCMVTTVCCARINCIVSGCCGGAAIPFWEGHNWPIRETEVLCYLIFVEIFANRVWKHKTHGEVYPIYMIGYGVLRFILQFLREGTTPIVGVFTLPHIWALLSVLLGVAGLILVKRFAPKEIPQKKKKPKKA